MSLTDLALDRLSASLEEPDLEGTRYLLLGKAGQGGMGTVWVAEDRTLGRRVALKVVDPVTEGEALAARLLDEARILAALEHPGIVPVHDAGTLQDGRAFYAMKLVEGLPLDAHASALSSRPDRLRLFLRVCEPIAFAHSRGVIHRDLKPENIMVGPFGEVLVLDWGVAKVLGVAEPASAPSRLSPRAGTAAGTVLGTRGWMAPEQEGASPVDERTDVFTLGRLLLHLLTPLGPPPRPLAAIAAKATALEPGARYQRVSELTKDVSRYLDGESVSAAPESVLQRGGRFVSRHRVAVLLVLTYLATRALLLLYGR